jgi:hypothetical protein
MIRFIGQLQSWAFIVRMMSYVDLIAGAIATQGGGLTSNAEPVTVFSRIHEGLLGTLMVIARHVFFGNATAGPKLPIP